MSKQVGPFVDNLYRVRVRDMYAASEAEVIDTLSGYIKLSQSDRKKVTAGSAHYVDRVRKETSPSIMEAFLAEYGLSTEEGVGLMSLAEALLRVPDAETIDDLIADCAVKLGRPGLSSSSLTAQPGADYRQILTMKLRLLRVIPQSVKRLASP
jgi:proline dehydrogenase